MKITITLNLPVEENPQCLPLTLRRLAEELEGDIEPSLHPMDGSLTVLDDDGKKCGLLEWDFDDEDEDG